MNARNSCWQFLVYPIAECVSLNEAKITIWNFLNEFGIFELKNPFCW